MAQPPGSNEDPSAGSPDLLAELYGELRRLAAARLAQLPPGNTLQPTALVHEAYLRLAPAGDERWNSRGHFFGAAARAMRQILVDQARRKSAVKHGGDQVRLNVDDVDLPIELPVEDILAMDQGLDRLAQQDPRKARIVELRMFARLSREEIAEVLGISIATLDREWKTTLARLHRELHGDS